MAKLWITEYAATGVPQAGRGSDAGVPVVREPALTTQVVDFTSGETQSSAFQSGTRVVHLYADTACHVLFGDVNDSPGPVADTNDRPMAADMSHEHGIDTDSITGLSVIAQA